MPDEARPGKARPGKARPGETATASATPDTEVVPIGERERREVIAATHDYIELAARQLQQRFAEIPVLFDLSGRTAGMFVVRGRRCWIRYNPWIFGKYYQESLRDTVAHEVAHYIVHRRHGRRGIKPHGAEWQAVMALFDADPGVTFKLDLSGIPQRRQRTHSYRCACREHSLSSTRHNRVQRGQGSYQCRACGDTLVEATAGPAPGGH